MRSKTHLLPIAMALIAFLTSTRSNAVNITLDYSYDTGFFAPGTQSRATLESAAGFYSQILNDTLDGIQAPSYTSPRVTIQWTWQIRFMNPSGTVDLTVNNPVIAANEYRVYVGTKILSGAILAQGAPGSSVQDRTTIGMPNSQDLAQQEAIDNAFVSNRLTRGETSGFAAWGGSIAFDSDRVWHTNYLTAPAANETDLYSTALHELAHTLGLGLATQWSGLISGSTFTGTVSKTIYGGPVPVSPDHQHWQEGLGSIVYGGAASQTAEVTPGLAPGVRKFLTQIDAAGLTDLGWEVGRPGDYNRDGFVNAADYTIWRNARGMSGAGLAADGNPNNLIDIGDFTLWKTNFGQSALAGGAGLGAGSSVPEPAGMMLAFMALGGSALMTRRRAA